MSEIIRAGLLSVDPGQELAGRALGMTRPRILRRVIVPQSIRIIIPPTGNEFITLLKLTSLASVISLHELLTAVADPRRRATSCTSRRYAAAPVYYLVLVEHPDGHPGPARAAVHLALVGAGAGGVAAPAVPAVAARRPMSDVVLRADDVHKTLRRARGPPRRLASRSGAAR